VNPTAFVKINPISDDRISFAAPKYVIILSVHFSVSHNAQNNEFAVQRSLQSQANPLAEIQTTGMNRCHLRNQFVTNIQTDICTAVFRALYVSVNGPVNGRKPRNPSTALKSAGENENRRRETQASSGQLSV
jgi:hypothetical protein